MSVSGQGANGEQELERTKATNGEAPLLDTCHARPD